MTRTINVDPGITAEEWYPRAGKDLREAFDSIQAASAALQGAALHRDLKVAARSLLAAIGLAEQFLEDAKETLQLVIATETL